MQARLVGGRVPRQVVDPQSGENRANHVGGGRGVGAFAEQHEREVLALVGQELALTGPAVHVADLEQRDVEDSPADIGDDGPQQPGKQRRAEDRFLARERVVGLDHVVRAVRQAGPLVIARAEQHGPDRIGEPLAHHHIAHEPPIALVRRQVSDLRRARHGSGDVLVAVVTRHLLDHVDLALGVGPEGGDGDVEHVIAGGLRGEADRCQVGAHGVERQVRAEDRVHSRHPHADACWRRHRAEHLAPAPRPAEQLDVSVGRRLGERGIDAAFESGRRLAAQAQPLRRAGDRHPLEVGRLEQHRRGRRGDLR